MSPLTRRAVLASVAGVGATAVAGCAGESGGGPGTTATASGATTTDCSATAPPKPTSAGAPPKEYPDAPSELTAETVESFVGDFERAYQYNRALAADPEKIGRLNTLEIGVSETTVESDGGTFTVSVEGSRYYSIATPEEAGTPTPTVTPLPMGRAPFSASYVVTPTAVRREDTTVRCL
jgi:hypothetical protein